MTTTPTNNAAIVKPAQQIQQMLADVQLDPAMLMAAKAIQALGGTDKAGNYKITADLAIAAVVYQAGTGQMLGRDFYVDAKMGRMEGYRGVQRDAEQRGMGPIQKKFRALTNQELQDHEIQPGDVAVACEIYQLKAWGMSQKMGVPYTPIIGIGIWRHKEKFQTKKWDDNAFGGKGGFVTLPEDKWTPIPLESGMTWHKKAQIRAQKEAMRNTPGGYTTDLEVFAEAAVEEGLTPPDQRMSMEDALAWVQQAMHEREIMEELAEIDPDELAARAAKNAEEMYGSRKTAASAGLHPAPRPPSVVVTIPGKVEDEAEPEAPLLELEGVAEVFAPGIPTMGLKFCSTSPLIQQWISDITHLPLKGSDLSADRMLRVAIQTVGNPRTITAALQTEIVNAVNAHVGAQLNNPAWAMPTTWVNAKDPQSSVTVS